MYPRIIADLDRLRENMERMVALCHAHGLSAALVTKCVCADARIAAVMAETDADFLADSRVENLARLPQNKPRYLLRVAQPSEVEDVVRHAEISQQSEPYTVRLLGEAAARQGKQHKEQIQAHELPEMGGEQEGIPLDAALGHGQSRPLTILLLAKEAHRPCSFSVFHTRHHNALHEVFLSDEVEYHAGNEGHRLHAAAR